MHFVAVKSEAQQARAMLFHTRDLLVRQRTQTINALRGHLAEYGVVAPQGRARIGQLAGVIEDGDCGLPEAVVELGSVLLGRIEELDEKILLGRGRGRSYTETPRASPWSPSSGRSRGVLCPQDVSCSWFSLARKLYHERHDVGSVPPTLLAVLAQTDHSVNGTGRGFLYLSRPPIRFSLSAPRLRRHARLAGRGHGRPHRLVD